MRSRIVSISPTRWLSARFRCSTWQAGTGSRRGAPAAHQSVVAQSTDSRSRASSWRTGRCLRSRTGPSTSVEHGRRRDLNDYVKFQMAKGMEKAELGRNGDRAGRGLSIAQQIMQQQGMPARAAPVPAPGSLRRSSVAGRCREGAVVPEEVRHDDHRVRELAAKRSERPIASSARAG